TLSLSAYKPLSPTQAYSLSLHDALPISMLGKDVKLEPVITASRGEIEIPSVRPLEAVRGYRAMFDLKPIDDSLAPVDRLEIKHRSEEHTSELQSLAYLVCRLLLEKKKSK